MGNRGPRPTPTAVLKQRGSRCENASRNEPRPLIGNPDCPEWLSDRARAKWNQLVPMLERMGVLTEVDGDALARYCDTWAWWRKSREFIEKYGESYPLKDEAGGIRCFQQYPQVAVCHKLALLLSRLEQEFGLTPSARSRIEVPKQAETKDGKGRFFKVVG